VRLVRGHGGPGTQATADRDVVGGGRRRRRRWPDRRRRPSVVRGPRPVRTERRRAHCRGPGRRAGRPEPRAGAQGGRGLGVGGTPRPSEPVRRAVLQRRHGRHRWPDGRVRGVRVPGAGGRRAVPRLGPAAVRRRQRQLRVLFVARRR